MSHTRYSYGILGSLLLLVSILSLSSAAAQPPCRCTASDTTTPMAIWIGGQYRSVDVTYCQDNYCPVNRTITTCNPGGEIIHARTVIRQICITDGGPPINDAQALFDATLLRMGICCGDKLFPVCIGAPHDIFNWLVSVPKCVQFDATGRCVTACDNSPCCTFLVQFSLTPTSDCVTTILNTCDEPGDCTGACISLQCRYPPCLP